MGGPGVVYMGEPVVGGIPGDVLMVDGASFLTQGAGGGGGGSVNFSAGTTSQNLTNIVFSNSNGVSFGLNGSTMTASVAAGGGGGSVNFSAGTTSQNLTNVVFSNSNSMSFGLNGSTITGTVSYPAQTNQQMTMFATGNTTQSSTGTTNASSIIFAGSGAASVGITGGSVLISVPNVVAQSNQSAGIYGSSQTVGQSSSSTHDARSLTVVGQGIVSVGWSNSSFLISATTPSQTNQQMTLYATGNTTQSSTNTTNASSIIFAGSGAASVGVSGGSILVSVPNVVAQTNQSLGIYGSSQTVGQSSSSTYDARSLTIVGSGIASVGWSNSSLLINASQTNQQMTMYATGNTTQSSTGTSNASSLIFNGAGNVSIGITNGSVIISGGTASPTPIIISAGTSSASISSVVFSNSNGVSFGLNGSTITASANAGNTVHMWPTIAYAVETSSAYTCSTTTTAGGSRTAISMYVSPFIIDDYVTYNQMMAQFQYSTVNGTGSLTMGLMYGLYTRNGASLSQVSDQTYIFQMRISQNSVTAQSQYFNWGTNTTSNSYSSGGNISTLINSRKMAVFFTGATSVTPGMYYLVYAQSGSTVGSDINAFSVHGVQNSQSLFGSIMGSAVSSRVIPMLGIASTTISSNAAHVFVLPSLIETSAITGTGGTTQNRSNIIYFANA